MSHSDAQRYKKELFNYSYDRLTELINEAQIGYKNADDLKKRNQTIGRQALANGNKELANSINKAAHEYERERVAWSKVIGLARQRQNFLRKQSS